MRSTTTILLLTIGLLTAPGALAHGATVHDADAGLLDCTGAIDFLCVHIDCTQTFCIRLVCPVYIDHAGHTNVPGFGCTPP